MEDNYVNFDMSNTPESAQYGSYNHFLLSLHVPKFRNRPSSPDEATHFTQKHTKKEQIDAALNDVALMHELRHFHDCFGTMAGISLFECHLSRLNMFLDICRKLYQEGRLLKLPLFEWADDLDCPAYVKKFIKDLICNVTLENIFSGRVDFPIQKGKEELVYKTFEVLPKINVPAFPLQIGSISIYEGHPPTFNDVNTSWAPIGFEQLIEGNAQALQRTYLEGVWPTIVDSVWSLMTTRAGAPQNESSEVRNLTRIPYNITDLLLTKYLSKQHNIEKFDRDRVLEISDRALMWGWCPSLGAKQVMRSAGGGFVLSMEDADWSKGTDCVVTKSPTSHEGLRTLASRYASTPHYSVTEGRNIQSAVDYIHRFSIHEIISPLIALRIQHGANIFFETEKYLKNLAAFPFPPLIFSDESLSQRDDIDADDFIRNWAKFAILSDVCGQIWSGAKLITCARAYNYLPGIKFTDLCKKPGCDNAIRNRECLTWDPRYNDPFPYCVFRDVLMTVRLMEYSAN
jgi:hypothetical protein